MFFTFSMKNLLKSPKKLILVFVAIIAAVAIIAGWSVFYTLGYIKQNIDQDLSIVFYENARDVLAKSPMPWLAQPTLDAINKVEPDLFLHYSDLSFDSRMSAYDYTKTPALFTVDSVDSYNQTVALKVVYPSVGQGEVVQAKLGCVADKTKIGQGMKATPALMQQAIAKYQTSKDLTDLKNLLSVKQVSTTTPLFTVIANALTGSASVELSATCTDYQCNTTGPECNVLIN